MDFFLLFFHFIFNTKENVSVHPTMATLLIIC